MQQNTSQVEIFISPHPDDICFSAFAAISQKNQDCSSIIINVFNRSCWTFTSEPRPENHKKITKIRREEELSFATYMGVQVEFLDLEDTSLRYQEFGQEYKQLPQQDPIYHLVQKNLLDALRQYTPVNRIYAPLGISKHVDHLICRDVVFKNPDIQAHIILYEDLPYIAHIDEESIKNYVTKLEPQLAPLPRSITPSEQKATAMNIYHSQLENHTIPTVINYGLKLGKKSSLVERYWTLA